MAKSKGRNKDRNDDQRDLDRALENQQREDLLGDMEENRNLTGSTTWETLGDKSNDENQQHGRRTQAASPREIESEPRAAGEDLKKQ
jgi:hypothetical protein